MCVCVIAVVVSIAVVVVVTGLPYKSIISNSYPGLIMHICNHCWKIIGEEKDRGAQCIMIIPSAV